LKDIHSRVFTRKCYGRNDGWTERRTDSSVTISLRNFVGEGIKIHLCTEMFGERKHIARFLNYFFYILCINQSYPVNLKWTTGGRSDEFYVATYLAVH